jgi:hypothetical protein
VVGVRITDLPAAIGSQLRAIRRVADLQELFVIRLRDRRAGPPQPEAMRRVRSLIEHEFGYAASFSHFPIVGLSAECAA